MSDLDQSKSNGIDDVQVKEKMEELAANYFKQGYNCCQSVLLATNDIWDLKMPSMLIVAGKFFQNGMSSGLTCGALVGAEMALGVLNEHFGTQLKNKTANTLYQEFVKAQGSSECRELRKKQGLVEKVGYKGCRIITLTTAGILYEFWEQIYGKDKNINNHSHLK